MMGLKSSGGMGSGMSILFASVLLFSSASVWAGDLEPSAPPGPTMKTLDQVPPTWSQILPAAQRFQLVMGGVAVLDKETGLVWVRSPSTSGFSWLNAQSHCNQLSMGGRLGWRLPTIQELASLVDPSVAPPGPTLPSGHPFSNVQSHHYWSASTSVGVSSTAWVVGFNDGVAGPDVKSIDVFFAWCVRGGQGVDPQ